MNPLVISLDAMGGDNAPKSVIEGASIVRKLHKNVSFLAYGDSKVIIPLLKKYKNLKSCLKVIHTDKHISCDEKPSNAVRRGRDSSMGLAIKAVKEGAANASVSAGNTGALMALSLFIHRPLDGVRRPAICSSIPTQKGWSCMLDLGANIEADKENLVQFGVMGAVFYRIYNKGIKPTVGLLNVGVEDMKGHNHIAEAGTTLSHIDMVNYKGFIEGDDIGKGTVDVVVTDGFSGNIALKSIEGTAKLIMSIAKKKFIRNIFGISALIIGLPALFGIKRHFDPARYNGAILLGLNGISVKSHGSATAKGFAAAIKVAIDLAEIDFTTQLKSELSIIDIGDIKNMNVTETKDM